MFWGFGNSNAGTSNNYTYLSLESLGTELDEALDIISSMVFSPRFENKNIKEQKQVVLREIADKKAAPNYQDFQDFKRKTLSANHPLVRENLGLGNEEVIKLMNRKDLIDFHARGYNANNAQLVLVGGIPKDIEKKIQHYFGNRPSGGNLKFKYPLVDSLDKKIILHTFAPDLVNTENPNESNSYLNLRMLVPPNNHEDRQGITMLANILGVGGNSLLFKKVREEKGLAYNIHSSYDGQLNLGEILISGLVKATRYEEAIDSIFKVFQELKEKPIEGLFLESKKRQAEYSFAQMQESNANRVNLIFDQIDFGTNLEGHLSKIDALTTKDIQKLANKYLPDKDGNYALLLRDPLKKD